MESVIEGDDVVVIIFGVMEKYGKWSDLETGVNPYTPAKNRTPELQYLLMFPVVLIKFLVFLIASFVGTVLLFLSEFAIPLQIFKRLFSRYVSFVYARGMYWLLGFYFTKEVVVKNKSGRNKAENSLFAKVKNNFVDMKGKGDVIICNFVSYVQVIYLGLRFDPLFVSVLNKKRTFEYKVLVHRNWLWYLWWNWGFKREGSGKYDSGVRLSEAIQSTYKPIVVFPEVVSSNGKSITNFSTRVFDPPSLECIKSIQIIGFKFKVTKFCPCFHLNNFYSHFFSLNSQFWNSMEVYFYNDSTFLKKDTKDQIEKARQRIGMMLERPLVSGFDEERKTEFMQYFSKTNKKKYV